MAAGRLSFTFYAYFNCSQAENLRGEAGKARTMKAQLRSRKSREKEKEKMKI